MRIYNLGSLNIDYVYGVEHFVRPGETLTAGRRETFPGGKGLNQSVALARAGAEVLHGGMVGGEGNFLLMTLRGAGADVSRVKRVPCATGHAVIEVDPSGQNRILLYPGANRAITGEYVEEFLRDARPGDFLLIQNETSATAEAIETARGKGMSVALNPSPFDGSVKLLPLREVDWWFCNEIEGAALFGGSVDEIPNNFLRAYPGSRLVLTLGERGSVYRDADTSLTQPAYPAKAVDTTAAGDTYTGYFLAAIAAGKPVETAMELATKAAAISVSREGASVSIPTLAEVEAL